MRENRVKEHRRRLGYSRHARGKKAVSPVVATLILILIAVAAAAALYLWLVAWHGGVTKGIGSPSAQYTVSIGGSTSVYPFASIAATQFEQNNSDVVISVNQGGTGAGMAAVCSGQIDIGEASAFEPVDTLVSSDGCPSTTVEEIVAYDGVDVIVPTANPHGLQSLSYDTLQAIWVDASATAIGTNGGTTGSGNLAANAITTNALTMDGVTWGAADPAQGAGFAWDQLPACAAVDLGGTCNGAAFTTTGYSTTVGGALGSDEAACGSDLCDATAQADSCGYSVCAGGTAAGVGAGEYQAPINLYYRSDVSGTTQSFLARLVAVGAGSTTQSIGFSGCSGDNQFDGCGLSYTASTTHAEDGNPNVILGVSGSKDGLGYASDGLVQAAGSGVSPVNFQGLGQSVIVNLQGESVALKAIAKGIADYNNGGATYATDQAYVGWRPFLNVETSPPTGEVLRYLQFVMDPANNENFAAESAEISVYASGLAGVVPVTPIP